MSNGSRRILVVEDDAEVQSLLARVLGGEGFEVEAAVNGEEALERLAARRPDLVLLDIRMPGLDGWGVLERMKSMPDAPPVIGLTALSDYQTFKGLVHEGVAGFLGKPFGFRDLIDVCQSVATTASGPVDAREGAERRQTKRRQLMVGVKVLSKERQPMTFGEILNISTAGAQLNLIAPLDPGSPVRVALQVSGGAAPGFQGLVRWRATIPRGYAHGVSFVDLTPDEEKQLHELLEA